LNRPVLGRQTPRSGHGESRNTGEDGRRAAANRGRASLCDSRAESAQEINGKAYQQNQAKPAAADDGTAKVKTAAAEQE